MRASVDSQCPCRKPGKEDLSNPALVGWREKDKDTSCGPHADTHTTLKTMNSLP